MDLQQKFTELFDRKPELSVRAPGRVNLLGEHVDYNDGPVLPVALDRAVYLLASPSEDQKVTLYAMDFNEQVSFGLDNLKSKVDNQGKALPGWALYPAGVAWALQEGGFPVMGVQVAYSSDVPIGAGLSSSAAVEVAFAVLWQTLGSWQIDRVILARLCQRAENIYVGLSCGLMDQFASACGVRDHALYFDTRSLEWEAVPLLEGTALVIADSGVRRSLTDSAYNERRAACEQAVELLKKYKPDIRSLRDVSSIEFAAYGDYLPQEIRRRAEHVVKEIARVFSAVNALQRDDRQAMGALMYAGHASLRDLYEVSHPALDSLVMNARQLAGCIGARMTGGGFGGCTINIVEETHTEGFIRSLRESYHVQTGREARVYLCRASDGASVEKTK